MSSLKERTQGAIVRTLYDNEAASFNRIIEKIYKEGKVSKDSRSVKRNGYRESDKFYTIKTPKGTKIKMEDYQNSLGRRWIEICAKNARIEYDNQDNEISYWVSEGVNGEDIELGWVKKNGEYNFYGYKYGTMPVRSIKKTIRETIETSIKESPVLSPYFLEICSDFDEILSLDEKSKATPLSDLAILDAKNEELKAKNEELKAENEKLKAKNEELKAKNEELKAENMKLKAKNEELKAENMKLKAKEGELSENKDMLREIAATIKQHGLSTTRVKAIQRLLEDKSEKEKNGEKAND